MAGNYQHLPPFIFYAIILIPVGENFMIPKILIMKSGERLIAGAGERKDNETGKGVCLVLKCPYILTLNAKQNENEDYTVNFSKWNPFSSALEYNVPYDAVVTISEPEQGILDVYLEKFSAELYYEGENDEQSEVDLTENE
jgi:hypothetical protein